MNYMNVYEDFNHRVIEDPVNKYDQDVIYPGNPKSKELIYAIIMENSEKGNFDLDNIIYEIDSSNQRVLELITSSTLSKIDYAGDVDVIFDFISDSFFSDSSDMLLILEGLVFDTVKEFNLPVELSKDQIFDFPFFMKKCQSEQINEFTPYDVFNQSRIHVNFAQQVMFADFLIDGDSHNFGKDNILLFLPESRQFLIR